MSVAIGALLAALLLQTAPDQAPGADDNRWMRGAFAGASAQEVAALDRIEQRATECRKTATARVRAELVAMGERAPALPERSYGSEPCTAIEIHMAPQLAFGDWDAWQAADATAKQLFAVFAYGVASRQEPTTAGRPSGNQRAQALIGAIAAEQAYRRALSWPREGPPIAPLVWEALQKRLWAAAVAEDHRNTALLKAMVAAQGWPTVQQVGEPASDAAWLIVQHADDDPAFQLRALRLMAPLLTTAGVSRRNHAYLYDRVMLKIAGKQRFGTQTRCLEGKRVALPLEDPARVDALRAEAGMGRLADHLAMLDRNYGACPG